ncbi:hypothetical protein, partial [Serratia marcescens]|uniref:hypothetical protein n=1 Tax=Serratia marcescens TaxID=615 RepID=UPI00344DE1A0
PAKKNKANVALRRQFNSNRLPAKITPRRCTLNGQANIFTAHGLFSTPRQGVESRPEDNNQT